MKNDYGGHANKLKDLARITLRFTSSRRLHSALVSELESAGIKVLTTKNKYASPTPMGYSDFNLCVSVLLNDNTTRFVCEMQLNLVDMVKAKKDAHFHYEKVRALLSELCLGTKVDAGELEAFIVGQLSSSSLDSAVSSLSAKAGGLFLYARLLAQHLESERAVGKKVNFAGIESLPSGLGQVYEVNFKRAFPMGEKDEGWREAKPLVQLIAAAMEPLSLVTVQQLLGWKPEEQERVLHSTALLFPIRDGKFHVFHKTVVDWLTGEIEDGSSVAARSEEFKVERRDGHKTLGSCFLEWLSEKAGEST